MADILLLEQELSFSYFDAFGAFIASVIPAPFTLSAGAAYRVIWDGEEFAVTGVDTGSMAEGSVAVGNGTPWGFAGNNEPFIIGYFPATDEITFVSLTDEAPVTHEIAVYQVAEEAQAIILKDRSGNDLPYEGAVSVNLILADGTEKKFVDTDSIPDAVETEVALDFSAGAMEVTPDAGKMFSKVMIPLPENLKPENIAEDVDIAGIVGTLAGGDGASNICVGTYTVGLTESVTSPVTLIPKDALDKIGFASASKKFAILLATKLTSGQYQKKSVAALVQSNYSITAAGSTYHYGVRFESYKSSSSAVNDTVIANYVIKDAFTTATDGCLYYDSSAGLQYRASSTYWLYYNTYIVIAGVIT